MTTNESELYYALQALYRAGEKHMNVHPSERKEWAKCNAEFYKELDKANETLAKTRKELRISIRPEGMMVPGFTTTLSGWPETA